MTLDPTLIEVGKAVKKEIFDAIKTQLDEHETDIDNLQSSATITSIFNDSIVNAASAASLTGIAIYQARSTITVNAAQLGIFETGALTGTLEFDVRKSSSLDFTSSTSIFTTRPSIDYSTASDYDVSTNAVFDAGQIDLVSGDFLRIDITSLPTNGTLGKFTLLLTGEPT